MKDLEYIAKHVKEWPERAATVRLDADGEICFIDSEEDDFYPEKMYNEGEFHPEFIPDHKRGRVGREYTEYQWETVSETLNLNTGKSVTSYQDIIAYLKEQIEVIIDSHKSPITGIVHDVEVVEEINDVLGMIEFLQEEMERGDE